MPSSPAGPEAAARDLRGAPFAHRGLHDAAAGIPENSPAAFAAAIEAGYNIELDVRFGADGEVIVFHDAEADRLTQLRGDIRDVDRRAARLLGSAETVPSLAETLELVAGRAMLLVEIKADDADAATVLAPAVAGVLAGYRGPLAVMSFDPAVIGWFAENAADVLRGQVSGHHLRDRRVWGEDPAAWREAWRHWPSRPAFVSHDERDLPFAPLAAARAAGLALLTWTVRTPARAAALAGEVDNITFEGFRP